MFAASIGTCIKYNELNVLTTNWNLIAGSMNRMGGGSALGLTFVVEFFAM